MRGKRKIACRFPFPFTPAIGRPISVRRKAVAVMQCQSRIPAHHRPSLGHECWCMANMGLFSFRWRDASDFSLHRASVLALSRMDSSEKGIAGYRGCDDRPRVWSSLGDLEDLAVSAPRGPELL